jgi:hypothetical protein
MGAPLLIRLRKAGLHVSRKGDELRVGPAARVTDELRAEIQFDKPQLLSDLRDEEAFVTAFRHGVLQQCQGCGHHGRAPLASNDAAAPGAGWCHRFAVASDPVMPFWCDGYSPLSKELEL